MGVVRPLDTEPWDGAGLLGKHARVFGMPRPQISTCSYPWDVFQSQPLPCTLSLFGLILALPRGLLGCMVRYGEIWWDMALECFSSSFFGVSCLPWSNWAWRSEGLHGYQVKNMGGIGAHCAEDYETLKMFVEAPSTYKDEQKTCWWQKPSGILFHWVDDGRCMGNWTDKYWQGNLVYLSWGAKDSNPTVAHCFSRSFLSMKIHPDTASRGQQTWARKCQIIQVRLLKTRLFHCHVKSPEFNHAQFVPFFSCLIPQCQYEACVYAQIWITNDLDISKSEDPFERAPECTWRSGNSLIKGTRTDIHN